MHYLPRLPSSPTSECQNLPQQRLLQFQGHFACGSFAQGGGQPAETNLNFGQCAHHLLFTGARLASSDIVAHGPGDSSVEEETRTCIDKVLSRVGTVLRAGLDVTELACLVLQQIEDVKENIVDRYCLANTKKHLNEIVVIKPFFNNVWQLLQLRQDHRNKCLELRLGAAIGAPSERLPVEAEGANAKDVGIA